MSGPLHEEGGERSGRAEPGGSCGEVDARHLDHVFELALECFEHGREPQLVLLIGDRADLTSEIERLVELARRSVLGAGVSGGSKARVPGYELLGELGYGGMGVVYLARQQRLGGRAVALKVLPAHSAMSQRMRERFRAEASTIARLHHPNIVQVYDIVQGEGLQAYAMEWIEGRTLGAVIDHVRTITGTMDSTRDPGNIMSAVCELLDAPARAGLPESYAALICRIGVQAAGALEAVHESGILHRDIKPSNILLRRDGTALLSDFGLAREQDAVSTLGGAFAGTAAYAAPEQLRGDTRALDRRSDVYALGATLYHALGLRQPCEGVSAAQVLRYVEDGRVPRLRSVNPRIGSDLETIVAKAMDPDPSRRYQTSREFGDDLQRLMELRPIRARPAGPIARAGKLMLRNRRTMIASGLVGTCVAALAAGLVFWFSVRPRMIAQRWREARATLVSEYPEGAMFNAKFWGSPESFVLDSMRRDQPASYEEADRAYQRVLALWPTDRVLRGEAGVVRYCRAAMRLAPELDPHLERLDLPETTRYLQWWRTSEGKRRLYGESSEDASSAVPSPDASLTRDAEGDDARVLGLAAYLLGDPSSAERVWQTIDVNSSPGSLAEAGLGLIYLLNDEPARAYPRLRLAAEAFPEISKLALNTAEAAIRCGDVDQARQLIARATNDTDVEQTKLQRVRILWMLEAGQEDAALAEYRRVHLLEQTPIWSPVLSTQVSEYLRGKGRTHEALWAVSRGVSLSDSADPRKSVQVLAPLLMGIWEGMSQDEKRRAISSDLEPKAYRERCRGILWRRSIRSFALGRSRNWFKVDPARQSVADELSQIGARLGPHAQTGDSTAGRDDSPEDAMLADPELRRRLSAYLLTGVGTNPLERNN